MKLIHILILILTITAFSNAEDVTDIIKNVQKKYEKAKYMSADFEQIDVYKLTGSRTETSGKIYIKDGVEYRFESDDQIIVTDGKTVWTYNNISKQLLIDEVRENSGALMPRDILYKYPKTHHAILLGEKKVDGKKEYEIKLEPKENDRGFLKSIRLWISGKNWTIDQIETTDLNGNTTDFIIKNLDFKTELDDSLFSFKAMPGVDVVDMR